MELKIVHAPKSADFSSLIRVPKSVVDEFDKIAQSVADDIANGKVILVSDNELRAMSFTSLAKGQKNWDKSGPCQYPRCNSKTIRRSHTVQRAGPLTVIKSQDGHVIAPTLDRVNLEIVEGRKGLDTASTFAGFCRDHEQIFARFEQERVLRTPRDYLLQFYRSLTREAVRTKFDIEHNNRLVEKFDALLSQRFKQRCLDAAPPDVAYHAYIDACTFNTDAGHSSRLREWVEIAQGDLDAMRGVLQDIEPSLEAVNQGILPATVHRYILPYKLPVTLSGHTAINLRAGDVPYRLIFFMIVIPELTTTQVLVASSYGDGKILEKYLDHVNLINGGEAVPANRLIDLIENFIFYGTDHWFFEEAFWWTLNSKAQNAILASAADEVAFGINSPPIKILPRQAQAVAQHLAISDKPDALFEDVQDRKLNNLFETRSERRIKACDLRGRTWCVRDRFNGDLYVVRPNRREGGWVFVRTMRRGQWRGNWRRTKWARIAPYGVR